MRPSRRHSPVEQGGRPARFSHPSHETEITATENTANMGICKTEDASQKRFPWLKATVVYKNRIFPACTTSQLENLEAAKTISETTRCVKRVIQWDASKKWFTKGFFKWAFKLFNFLHSIKDHWTWLISKKAYKIHEIPKITGSVGYVTKVMSMGLKELTLPSATAQVGHTWTAGTQYDSKPGIVFIPSSEYAPLRNPSLWLRTWGPNDLNFPFAVCRIGGFVKRTKMLLTEERTIG